MSRNAEQIAADEALTAAIQQVQRAYHGHNPRLLTDYVVIAAEQGIDDDGDSETAMSWYNRDNEVPLYRLIGLLDYALTRQRRQIGSGRPL